MSQFHQSKGSGWTTLGRLQNNGVTDGDGWRNHPERDHAGEVEGRNSCDHPQWLADRVRIDARAGALCELALLQMRNAAHKFHHIQTALQLAGRIAQQFAMLGGHQVDDLLPMLFD